MPTVTRWIFEYGNSDKEYNFPRNPDRLGGDSYWNIAPKMTELDVIGASQSNIQIDGFSSGRRVIRFTAIAGTMMRKLQDFYLAKAVISNCRDHLYDTTPQFSCFIVGFIPMIHPSLSTEDLWDLEMTLVRTN